MTRERVQHRCRDCGAVSPRWTGRCGQCGEWNTLEEHIVPAVSGAARSASSRQPPVELHALASGTQTAVPTGLEELDRVLGGGLVPSSVTLITGEPGIGKSTLLLQVLCSLAERGARTLLVAAEESPEQVHHRASRLGRLGPGLWVTGETDLAAIRAAVAELSPDVLVVDSIQTISDAASGSAPGTVASVRDCAQMLAADAKAGGPATVLVGHVTKDGDIAGPRVLEHLVDTVLSFEGDRHHALRLLRAVKHRFGAVGELGLWEMTQTGLAEVPDAAGMLLCDRHPGTPGSVVFASMEGRRPLLVEIQALVAPAHGGPPRRSASGYSTARLAQLLAVLDRRGGVGLAAFDVYVSVVGGVRLSDPGADLAVSLAVASAATGQVVDASKVVIGEVGLGGEVRQVSHTPRRLSEAARLGFLTAVTAVGAATDTGISVAAVVDLAQALDDHLGAAAPPPRARLPVG